MAPPFLAGALRRTASSGGSASGACSGARLLRKQVAEGLAALPAVRPEVPRIGRKNPAVALLLSTDHERGVREIHRKIAVLLHQFEHARQMPGVQVEDLCGTGLDASQPALREVRVSDALNQMEGLGHDEDLTFDTAAALQNRFVMQTVVFQCFAKQRLDAMVYPTGNIPPSILTSPREPSMNDRGSGLWTQINRSGIPAMTVPAGFTTRVHDRSADGVLLPAIAAELPVGIDFLGLPFSEAKLFEIGAAYERATRHRRQPPDFGPLDTAGRPPRWFPRFPRPMPRWRRFTPDELRAIEAD